MACPLFAPDGPRPLIVLYLHTHVECIEPRFLLRPLGLLIMSRPEHQAPPEIYYNDTEAQKYTANTRNQEFQAEKTLRAIELLALPEHRHPALIMEIGCGSGR